MALYFPSWALKLQATLVHQAADKPAYGFQFHALAETQANEERENLIWRFLMNEQRRARRTPDS